jgi:cytochrome c nitrite reductase small subunit
VYRMSCSYSERVGGLTRQGQHAGRIRLDVAPDILALLFLGLIQPSVFLWHISGAPSTSPPTLTRPGRCSARPSGPGSSGLDAQDVCPMRACMRAEIIAGVILAVALGLAGGIGGYTFIYARGASYLTNDPAACANCHIMREHFAGWMKSRHQAVAVCNDCHTPPGVLAKYATKAANGFWHSFAFTSGRFPEPLRIKPHNQAIAERACQDCHRAIVEAIDGPHRAGGHLSCLHCHASVGHL